MQLYAAKFHYFMRYGEKNNCVVLDITDEQKLDITNKKTTMSDIYEDVKKNPVEYVKKVKERGITKFIGILGKSNGSFDDSNGSGKSTLLEGITYLHYDRVIRKLINSNKTEKAGLDVVTKFNKKYPKEMRESYVESIFEESGKIYRIKRGRTFSKTHKDSSPILEFQCYNEDSVDNQHGHRKDDTEINIEKVNMVDYDLFVSTQMFGQNDSGKFLIGTDKIKKEMIINLLKLDNIVDGCIGEVRSRKNNQDKKLQGIRSNVDLTEKNIYRACSKWIDTQKHTSFSDDIIALSYVIIDGKIKLKQEDVKQYSSDIKNLDEIIEELKKSDKIKLLEDTKSEGLKLAKEKEEKETQIKEQTKEWDLLIEENVKSSTNKNTQKENTNKKINELKDLHTKNKKVLEDPTVAKAQKYLLSLSKIKEQETEISKEAEIKLKELEDVKMTISVLESKIETKKLEELLPLNSQVLNTTKSKFICRYCKSSVDREHILSEIEKVKKDIQALQSDLDKVNLLKDKFSNDLKSIRERLSKVVDLIKKEVTANNIINGYNNAQKKEIEIENSIIENNEQLITTENEIKDLDIKNSEYKQKRIEIKDKFNDSIAILEKKILELRNKYSEIKLEVKSLEEKIEDQIKNKNGLVELKSQADKSIGSMNSEKIVLENTYEELKKLKESVKYEAKVLERLIKLEDIYGLDGIQTRIVQKYLPLLNVYVKEYMDILTDGSRGIDIYINSKNEVALDITGNSAWSYEMSSGGEKMIIRLAVDIGLSLLSFSRLSKKPELICLDEIFGPLDNSHTQAVFKVLNKLGNTFNRVIIIDHKSEIQKIIKDNIIIEKNDGNSSFSEIKCFGSRD